MSTFVLVPGAWLGGWCWQRVASTLRNEGHDVYSVTLTGLGEREHLGYPSVGLATHVQDVVNLLDFEGLTEVILVGHSYAGMVVGSVASQRPERLRQLIFLAANLPHAGESIFDTWSPRGRTLVEDEARAGGVEWRWPFPAADLDTLGPDLTETDRQWLLAKVIGHPLQTFRDAAPLSPHVTGSVPHTFIHCSVDGSSLPAEVAGAESHWRLETLAAGHWPMISRPGELVRILLTVASLAS